MCTLSGWGTAVSRCTECGVLVWCAVACFVACVVAHESYT